MSLFTFHFFTYATLHLGATLVSLFLSVEVKDRRIQYVRSSVLHSIKLLTSNQSIEKQLRLFNKLFCFIPLSLGLPDVLSLHLPHG